MAQTDHGPRAGPDIASTVVRKQILRGNPRLLIRALPFAAAVVLLKVLFEAFDWTWFELSPLLAAAISAEVFILGFLLAGTAGDFKEAERLPGEVAASLESIADECLITYEDIRLPEAKTCLQQLIEISISVRSWLMHGRGLDDVLTDIRALNGPYRVMAPAIQAGFTTRLKSEQAVIRKLVIRMDTMRQTSYVGAGYMIAELTALILCGVLVLTDLGPSLPNLSLVALISYVLFYLVGLIRDLDNPFEYDAGEPGAADVNLDVLGRNEDRLRALLGSLDAVPAAAPTTTVTSAEAANGVVAVSEEPVEPPV
jgi:predicted membrane chloride channel (bestrophin family)